MARPKKPAPADGLVNVSASMPAPLVAAVDEIATRENRSRSNAIVELLKRAIEAQKAPAA